MKRKLPCFGKPEPGETIEVAAIICQRNSNSEKGKRGIGKNLQNNANFQCPPVRSV